MKKLNFIIFVFISLCSFSQQNQFSNGFDYGFKKGYCFDIPYGCMPPLTPLAPLTKLNEKLDNWQDGYNRGFVVGQELNRYNSSMNAAQMPLTPNYIAPVNPVPSAYVNGQYVPPVDLNVLKLVLEYKQKLFDTRGAWIQKRVDDLSVLNDVLVPHSDSAYSAISTLISLTVDVFNDEGGDLTDNNVFFDKARMLRTIETAIINNYLRYKNKMSK